MTNRRKNKGYRLNYSSFHHNSSKKSTARQNSHLSICPRQEAAMDVLIKAHQSFTGDNLSFKQIDLLSVQVAKAFLKAKINGSEVLEIEWLDWKYFITREWYEQCCPQEKLLSGLRGMTALTARGGRINYDLSKKGGIR